LIHPRSPHTAPDWLQHTGYAAVALLALAAELSASVALAALALATLAFALALRWHGAALAREPLLWCAGAFIAYLLARTAWAAMEFPGTGAMQWRESSRLLQLWLFPVTGWWLAGRPRRLATVAALALAGFAAGVAWRWDRGALFELVEQGRSGFGLPALAFALYSLTALLGLVLLAPRVTGPRHSRWFVPRAIAWLALAGLLTEGLILTGSRSAWLATALVLPVAAWMRYRHSLGALSGRTRTVAVLATIMVASTLLAVNAERLRTRLVFEADTLAALVQLDTERIPLQQKSSLGARYHLNRYGLQKFAERPVFGWGPGASRWLLDRAEPKLLRIWVDLHNTYLEILVRLGLVGAGLFAAGAWLLWRGVREAVRDGRLPRDWGLFLGASFAAVALWSLTDFRLTHTDFRFFWLVLGGMAAGAAMRARATD